MTPNIIETVLSLRDKKSKLDGERINLERKLALIETQLESIYNNCDHKIGELSAVQNKLIYNECQICQKMIS